MSWAMSNTSTASRHCVALEHHHHHHHHHQHHHQQQQVVWSVGEVEGEEDVEEDKARCEWDFHRSTVVSPAAATREVSDVIGAIEFDPADRFLATGGIARKIRIYNLSTLKQRGASTTTTYTDHAAACSFYICTPAKLSSLRWRPGSSFICSGDYDGVVTEYDMERQVPVFERDEHAGRRVWSVDYSPDGALGASGSDDGTAQLWDARCGSGARVAAAQAGGPVCAVEFDPDGGPWIGVGSADRNAYVYDLRAVSAGPLAAFGRHERAVTYFRFAGSGRRVATSGTDGALRLWEWEGRRKQVRAFRGHVNARSFVGMSVWRGAGLVASGSESSAVFVYDLRWGNPIWVHEFNSGRGGAVPEGFVSAVSWRQATSDCSEGVLAAGGSDGVLQVFVAKRKAEYDD